MANFVRRTMVVLVGALALWVAVPAIASARPAIWRLNGTSLTESIPVEWSGKVKLTDKPTAQVSVECTEKAEGSLGVKGAGEMTKITLSECTGGEACAKAGATITAVDLPWHVELFGEEASPRLSLVSGGKGAPGLKMACKVLGVTNEDTCSGTLGTSTIPGGSGEVVASFISTDKLNCTIGGSNSGFLEGSQNIVATKGGKLSTYVPPAEWLASGVPIKGEGSSGKGIEWREGTMGMAVGSKYGPLEVRCQDSGVGTVGENGTGTVTEFSFSKCEAVGGECNGKDSASITALHLPWKTQLAFGSKESVRLSFAEDGAGAPGFKFSCYVYPNLPVSFECDEKALPAGPLTNQEHGVLAEMNGGGPECSKVAGSEFAGTSEKLELKSAETLSVS